MKLVSQNCKNWNSEEEFRYEFRCEIQDEAGFLTDLEVSFYADFECCGGMLREYSCNICGTFLDSSWFTLELNLDYLYDISGEPFSIVSNGKGVLPSKVYGRDGAIEELRILSDVASTITNTFGYKNI